MSRRHLVHFAIVASIACSGGVELDPGSNGPTTDCTGADPFVAGMMATTEQGNTVSLVEATPTPPDVGDNVWIIEVTSSDGPLSGLAPEVVPWMPLHGHGLVPARYLGSESDPGRYEIDLFDLIMPGVWEFTIDLDPGAEASDAAVFSLCAEG